MILSLLVALAAPHVEPDTTLRLPRNGAIEIDAGFHNVSLRVGTGDVVTVRGASAELDGGTLSVSAEDGHHRGPASGMIDVTVPAWCQVEVSTMTGNLTFTGTPARLHAETVSGSIRVNGGTGVLELESVGGAVVVADFRGTKLSIDATGENVTVTNSSGDIEIDDVSGNVVLRGIRSSSVTAGSVNGTVEFEGDIAANGSYEFSSQNRNVTLTLPGDVDARLRVSTMNGGLETEIPATTNGNSSRVVVNGRGKGKDKDKDKDERDIVAVYGRGTARISVDVFNGNVVVKRKA